MGYGQKFQGIYDVQGKESACHEKANHGAKKAITDLLGTEEALERSNLSDLEKSHFWKS